MRSSICLRWFTLGVGAVAALPTLAGQAAEYRVRPIAAPPLERPAAKVAREELPRGATGALPTFDGEPFHLNLPGASEAPEAAAARAALDQVARALGWARSAEELGEVSRVSSKGASREAVEQALRARSDVENKRLTGKLGRLTPATRKAIEDRQREAAEIATRGQEVLSYPQRVKGVRIEEGGVHAVFQSGRGLVALGGRVFTEVNPANASRVTQAEAVAAARAHVARTTKLAREGAAPAPELVLLPYGRAFRFAWRVDVAAEEGPYRLWIDAESRQVLRLDPLFGADSGNGLAFDPNPGVASADKGFEVNAPASSGAPYALLLAGRVDCNNAGADGVSSGDLTIASGGGSANFDVSPLNGTVVERTNQANYNSRFQDVNAYAWVFNDMKTIEAWGSRTFPSVTVTVNHNNPCGFGMDNSCGGTSFVTLGIGTATTSTSTAAGALFNSAIDATVVTHEFGHVVNRLQLTGISTGALDEGLADFWAATIHDTDTFGGWWKHNGGSVPVQTGFVPRQAEALDVFPEHRAFSTDSHADGQIINWALWSTRSGLLGTGALGALVVDTSLVKALTTASAALSGGSTDKGVHDTFLNLLQQLLTQITSSTANKLLAGFARAGITLSERDAVIDIGDDFLARGSATGPSFTVFGGRDYQFTGTTASAGAFFNTRFQVEVANDAAFTVNHRTGAWTTAIAVNPQGVPMATWTLPVGDWNAVKGGNSLFYRVTTTDGTGGNARVSTSPGNGFKVLPVPFATINASGECECSCASVAPGTPDGQGAPPWVALLPLALLVFWRRRPAGAEAA